MSKVSIIVAEGLFGSSRLTTMMAMKESTKPGMISYMPHHAPWCQIWTVNAPTIIPTKAPLRVTPFHRRERIMIGPKEAPKPPQA